MRSRLDRIRQARNSWRRRALAAEAELERYKRNGYPVERTTLDGIGFHGCDNQNPDYCSCNTWTPIKCAACGEEIEDGEVFWHYHATPWFPDDEPGRWDADYWHISCDGGVNIELPAEVSADA